MVTLDLLQRLFPSGRQLPAFASALAEHLPRHGVDTPQHVAAFLAQVGHETGGLVRWTENLNYSADGLRKTWPQRFRDAATANAYARQPERIANRVYADRMGNGPDSSGDGWRFRGRGLIQVTGRDNYTRLADYTGRDPASLPAWLETPEGATVSACWFWSTNKLSLLLETQGFDAVSRRINGGDNGMVDRRARYAVAADALGLSKAKTA